MIVANSRVKSMYSGKTGTVLNVWDGKCKDGQYNPYRVTVKWDNSTEGLLSNGTSMSKMEHLVEI